MDEPLRVLIVEDSMEDTFFIVRELQRGGYAVDFERVETQKAMEQALDQKEWDLVISDYQMPGFDGSAALELFRAAELDVPFIIVSGVLGEIRAVEMLKSGAHDYVMKDNLARLAPATRRELAAAQERRNQRQTESAKAYLASLVQSCEDAIIGTTLDGTIVSWNEGAQRLYGYSAGEMIGCSAHALVPSYHPDERVETVDRIQHGEQIQAFETVRQRKDGSVIDVSLTISPIRDTRGGVVGISIVARNIARRKQEETEQLSLIQELTAALSRGNEPS